MNTVSSRSLGGTPTVASYSVRTMTKGDALLTWPARTIELAELLARKLSVAAIDNATYPNPFFVVEPCGTSRCHFLWGTRNAAAPVGLVNLNPESDSAMNTHFGRSRYSNIGCMTEAATTLTEPELCGA